MSEGEPHRRRSPAGRPADSRDAVLGRIREVLDRALGPAPTTPPEQAVSEIAAILSSAGAEAGHGLSQADLDLYVRLWWGES